MIYNLPCGAEGGECFEGVDSLAVKRRPNLA